VDPFPTSVVLVSGLTMFQCAMDGSVDEVGGAGRAGLYDCDTRVLSHYRLTVDGRAPDLLTSAVVDASRWTATLRVPRSGGTPDGPLLPQDAIELTIVRRVGLGMLEEIEVCNHSAVAATMQLALALDGDFVEVIDLESARHARGARRRQWSDDERTWLASYDDTHEGRRVHRAVRARVLHADVACAVSGSEHGLRVSIALPARGVAQLRLAFESLVDGRWRSPLDLGARALDDNTRDRARRRFQRTRAHAHPVGNIAVDAFEQAAEDLFSLRLWELDSEQDVWIPAAGVPLYSGIFGRDILTAGWQASLVTTDIARGALLTCARTQGTRDDAFLDEEPGRMIHEMRRGPLSELGVIPQARYYGSQTTPAMFVVALTELWHWTGDLEVLRHYKDTALRAFAWAERYGDLDGDGLLEYRRRTSFGPKNQGWKDSDEAIRYPDGAQVANPIATIEENAFHCVALERMAELLVALDEDGLADEYVDKARAMKERWHRAFWMPEIRAYAMALDADKQQVASIGSNVGHALGTGIVPAEHARDIVDRLLAPDMFSGWGVRTLSSDHPSYNPLAYHLGTVWPVENATFALGCKRYGFDEEAERLVTALLEAASHFRDCRLPEVISGHARTERATPTVYPGACSPQAWSASAAIQLVQVLLGLYPFAALRVLALVRPRLPAWLPVLTLENVRVGDAVVSLRFERDRNGDAHHEILEQSGTLRVMHAAPPNDSGPRTTAAAAAETLRSFAVEHAPGRRARALRMALGVE
jgi:glycogen debranching enzyme